VTHDELSGKTGYVEPFDFQLYSSWGIPDFSPYPLPERVEVESPENFLKGVEDTLVEEGVWKATTEYRMGGTTRVEITRSKDQGVGRYHVRVAFGGLVTTGDYDTLEHALRASPPMAYALASAREQGAWKGLIEH
jgi:hypothetical protein